MPIHLPPISRRQFLVRSLACGAALAFDPRLFAAEKPAAPNSWALLSDPHLAADRTMVVKEVNMTDHFTAVARELLELPKRPAGVFINGDCAYNSGQPGDYRQLLDLLKPIRTAQMPVHLTVGNHDDREHFWEALPEEKAAQRPVADRQVSLLRTEHANWFLLDSLEKTLSTPGLLGKEQLDWLAGALDANRDKPAIVLLHHNPGLSGNMGLKDTAALFEVLRPRKQVKAYIYGHTHAWNAGEDDSGLHLINLPAVSYAFTAGLPTGWVHATLQPDGMQLELRCVDQTHKSHGQVTQLQWRAS
jgi:3',5'-cyclic-AMP phosphodiesterase